MLAPVVRCFFKVPQVTSEEFHANIRPRLSELSGGTLADLEYRGRQLIARVHFAMHPANAWLDSHGGALIEPSERREIPPPCRGCAEQAWCGSVEIVSTAASDWRRLVLISEVGTPTRRGILFSFFQQGGGLAIGAALEDECYPIDDLIFDLANLCAGPRFAGDESRFGGHLGAVCQRTYERADLPGYLEMGVPPEYGAGAAEVVRAIIEHGLIEWRSLLRHLVWAPPYDCTDSPALADLPPLTAAQQRR